MLVFVIWLNVQLTKAQVANDDLRQVNEELRKAGREIMQENQQLEKWKHCLNVERMANGIIAQAKDKAHNILINAKLEAQGYELGMIEKASDIAEDHIIRVIAESRKEPEQDTDTTALRQRILELENKIPSETQPSQNLAKGAAHLQYEAIHTEDAMKRALADHRYKEALAHLWGCLIVMLSPFILLALLFRGCQ
jgi:hypothetical protein